MPLVRLSAFHQLSGEVSADAAVGAGDQSGGTGDPHDYLPLGRFGNERYASYAKT